MSCQIANRLAASPKNKLGLDPMTILGILSSLFSLWKMCNPDKQPTAEMVQRKLATKWNARKEEWHKPFLNRVAHDVQEAAEHHGTEGIEAGPLVHEEFSVELLDSVRLAQKPELDEALWHIT